MNHPDTGRAQLGRRDAGRDRAAASFHGIILVVSMGIILLSFILKTNDSNLVFLPCVATPLPESCFTKLYWGMDCPGCGMTRAMIRISHGEFRSAVALNQASPIVYLFFLLQIPWHALQLLRIRNGIGAVDSWWTIVPVIMVIVTLVTCWFRRM